uniref:Uncharacterized protein n=1 Tax=Tetraselmis sp. GSL018 TaxID=582737 RepID=A0A061R2P9_9CHLO|eukprot:CAMPEP_0177606096 /NCGR_PEP_ID=MMETSP0419_2-20121207/17105_1 /TAXON_ID=582737 /ORGANISM="Tetraselmis sp., Strain GSL018" /LENGTH=148 /DNA_ID=CAMNT_0019100395 /DNA_START=128 /DNA_END=574 /DNA_ORIENTATION=+
MRVCVPWKGPRVLYLNQTCGCSNRVSSARTTRPSLLRKGYAFKSEFLPLQDRFIARAQKYSTRFSDDGGDTEEKPNSKDLDGDLDDDPEETLKQMRIWSLIHGGGAVLTSKVNRSAKAVANIAIQRHRRQSQATRRPSGSSTPASHQE